MEESRPEAFWSFEDFLFHSCRSLRWRCTWLCFIRWFKQTAWIMCAINFSDISDFLFHSPYQFFYAIFHSKGIIYIVTRSRRFYSKLSYYWASLYSGNSFVQSYYYLKNGTAYILKKSLSWIRLLCCCRKLQYICRKKWRVQIYFSQKNETDKKTSVWHKLSLPSEFPLPLSLLSTSETLKHCFF